MGCKMKSILCLSFFFSCIFSLWKVSKPNTHRLVGHQLFFFGDLIILCFSISSFFSQFFQINWIFFGCTTVFESNHRKNVYLIVNPISKDAIITVPQFVVTKWRLGMAGRTWRCFDECNYHLKIRISFETNNSVHN